jgi:hypothetical protein
MPNYYFQQIGATLEYGHIIVLISELDEIVPILARNVPLLIWGLFVGGLFYLTLGPWLLRYALKPRQGWPEGPRGGRLEISSSLISLGSLVLALSFGSLSVLTGTNALARTFVNVILPGIKHPATHVTLAETAETEKRNVVLVHLEPTREHSVTPLTRT